MGAFTTTVTGFEIKAVVLLLLVEGSCHACVVSLRFQHPVPSQDCR